MRVRLTFDFSREEREALAEQIGHSEPLDNHDLRNWILKETRATLDVIVSEYQELTKVAT